MEPARCLMGRLRVSLSGSGFPVFRPTRSRVGMCAARRPSKAPTRRAGLQRGPGSAARPWLPAGPLASRPGQRSRDRGCTESEGVET